MTPRLLTWKELLERVPGVICCCYFINSVHMFIYWQICKGHCNTVLHKMCSYSRFRFIIFSISCSQSLCGAFMWTTTLCVIVCAAWDRPDHERPGGCGKGPAAIRGHSPASSSPSQLQTALRQQRTPGKPFNRQQRLSQSRGRVPLQEMRQVSHQRCHISYYCCDGDVGMSLLTWAKLTASVTWVT